MNTITVNGLVLAGYDNTVHGWPGDPFTANARRDIVLDDGTRVAFNQGRWTLLAAPAAAVFDVPNLVWGTLLLTNTVWGDWRLIRANLSGGVWRLGPVVDTGKHVVSPQPRPDWMAVA